MCLPIAAVPLALGVASAAVTAAQGVAASQQAKQQRDALGVQRAAQAEEIAYQASTRAGARVQQARAERAKLTVAAGEAGVSGISVHDLLTTSGLNQSQDVALINQGAFYQDRASQAEYQSGLARAQGPSAFELGLGIAKGGLSGYDTGQDFITRVRKQP